MAEEFESVDTSGWEEVTPGSFVYELADGGTVAVTDDTIVPIGEVMDGEAVSAFRYPAIGERMPGEDVLTFRQLTYTNGGCRIVFEVNDRVPGCVSITLTAQDRPIRAKDLTAIKLDRIREEAFREVGLMVPWRDERDLGDAPARLVRKTLNKATSRRKITPEFLRKVADIYESAEGDQAQDRIEAVKTALAAGERQAFRYIAAAREKGFIK